MPTCGRPYHALAPAIHSITRATPCRLVRASSRPSSSRPSTLSFSPGLLNASPSGSSPQAYSRERKFNDLRESLLRGASPSRVWADYNDLLNVMGFEKLPLEIHQQVLRRCTSPSAEHRVNVAKRLAAGNSPPNTHAHEGRFRSIIHNIRASSTSPDLEDYHFILEQFAAVGHHIGVVRVYKELRQAGIEPQPKTFSLCLQAIARRMTLPVPNDRKEYRSEETRKMMYDLVREMRALRIAFTAPNLDLTIRILKETVDMETFEELMKWGYGIDLSHPDCPPLEFLASQNIKSDLGIQVSATSIPTQQPFSTAALNTTIDILGRIGNVPKLVQAFEVLTQPLPCANKQSLSFDDDDEDGGVANTPHSTWIPPRAYPNTTSYIMLIRHLCWAGHAIFARHYAREAIYLDLQKERRTKTKILTRLNEISAPTIAVNRGTLLPILGLSNRTKNLTLTRWLTRKLPGILRIKRYNLEYYTKYREKVEKRQAAEQAQAEAKRRKVKRSQRELSPETSTVDTSDVDTLPADTNADTSAVSTIIPNTSLNAQEDEQSISLIERSRRNKPQVIDIFELDIDALPPLPPLSSKQQVRLLDIDLHIRVLSRDIAELEEFSERVDDVLGRNTQRIKEHLGRRVWADKDIYLADEHIRRKVSREEWIENVGFDRKKPRDPLQGSLTRVVANDHSSPPFFQSNQTTLTDAPKSVLEHLAHGSNQS